MNRNVTAAGWLVRGCGLVRGGRGEDKKKLIKEKEVERGGRQDVATITVQ